MTRSTSGSTCSPAVSISLMMSGAPKLQFEVLSSPTIPNSNLFEAVKNLILGAGDPDMQSSPFWLLIEILSSEKKKKKKNTYFHFSLSLHQFCLLDLLDLHY
eukprot:TRINITY_DN16651_c0_g2_i11.p1 TRINITY_DN16651_c0_g2~~TRINITY_DN16651_c0_g2_i11.p1  ORF type:complete len:102 (+),score=12.17 TRINITY_DN16651_c0_g2_i11:174-479(+)